MKKVIVASTNPVKIAVADDAFRAVFPNDVFEIIGVEVDSGVPDQPFGDETIEGAENRLARITELHPEAHYWISQEGGLFEEDGVMFNRAWIMIADSEGHVGQSSTGSFEIPQSMARLVRTGLELGTAGDRLFNETNIKQKGGVLHPLTDGLIDRKNYYLQSAIIALCQVKNHHLYTKA